MRNLNILLNDFTTKQFDSKVATGVKFLFTGLYHRRLL